MRIKSEDTFLYLIFCIFLMTGGFYPVVNCLLSLLLCACLIYMLIKKRCFSFKPTLGDLGCLAITLFYFLVTIWSVDRGMALMGASKLFCLIPFILIILQKDTSSLKSLATAIPFSGVISVILCIILYFTSLHDYVFIANRMSGFFGYANTFALFLLTGIMCEHFYGKKNKIIYLILSVGIIWSGSRGVFVFFLLLILCASLISLKAHRKLKYFFMALAALAIVITAGLFLPFSSGIFKRLTDISLHSSTFLGRLLYMQDALPLILKFPFGMGAFGYSYTQGLTATGLYSVKYVHNFILQFILDIGIVPALAGLLLIFFGWTKKKNPILIFIFLHSLIDINMEYVSIVMATVLFLHIDTVRYTEAEKADDKKTGKEKNGNKKTGKEKTGKEKTPQSLRPVKPGQTTHIKADTFIVCLLSCFTVCLLPLGLSNLFQLCGNYSAACAIFTIYTDALEDKMENSMDIEEISATSLKIISLNKYNAAGYQMAGALAYLDDDAYTMSAFLDSELELVPYIGNEYRSYASYLLDLADKAVADGDSKAYDFCLSKLRYIYDLSLDKTENMSYLGKNISEQPNLKLSEEVLDMLK